MDNKAIAFKGGYLDQLQIQAILVLLVTACILPFIIHLIPPYNGIPMGAFLLPMFYIPFIAVFFYKLHVGLIIAALAPIINFLITGNPDWQFITVLSVELVVFTLFAYVLLKTHWSTFAAPLAYLLTKILSSLLLFLIPVLPISPIDFFSNSITNGAPGVVVLLVINWLLIKKWNK
jgi:membrane-associated HD superfamily phosphohydrolase